MSDTDCEDSNNDKKKAYHYILEQALNRLGRREHNYLTLSQSLKLSAERRHYLLSNDDNVNYKQIKRACLPLDNLSLSLIHDLINEVVSYCIKKNWCSNKRFVNSTIKSMRNNGHSSAFISATLNQKGISSDEYELPQSTDEQELTSAVIYLKRVLRRYPNKSIDINSLDFKKIMASMARRGYNLSISFEAWYKTTGRHPISSVNSNLFL